MKNQNGEFFLKSEYFSHLCLTDSDWSFVFYKRPFTTSFHSVSRPHLKCTYETTDKREDLCKINWFTHLDTSEKTCVEDKLCFFLYIGKNRMLALPVVIVDDGI